MGFLKCLFGDREAQGRAALGRIQTKFAVFRALLDQQNQVLKAISGVEEAIRQRWPVAPQQLAEIQEGVGQLIERMIVLGGSHYDTLRERYEAVCAQLAADSSAPPATQDSELVIPFDSLGRAGAPLVGTKNANLGELKSRLGLPVPNGFAISTSAYRHFLAGNRLQERIEELFRSPAGGSAVTDVESTSAQIRSLIFSSTIPSDLADAIQRGYDELAECSVEKRFAMRSSAIDEDTAFTFAGQYVTFLNVRRSEVLDCYKKILASQFAAPALRHFMALGRPVSDLAMGVACMAVVDAAASGVVYTRNPLSGDSDYMLVNSVFGLGSYLVEGLLTPDVFHVSRRDGGIQYSHVARKPVQLALCDEGGVEERAVPDPEQEQPSLSSDLLSLLAGYARRIETHYGVPQDIEWAVDREGRLFLLQTRPLRVIKPKDAAPAPLGLHAKRLCGEGTPICPGAGGGPVCHVQSLAQLDQVPAGVVLVARRPSPRLIAVMHKIKALVTEVGGAASHLATLAREAGLPTVAGIAGASQLPDGLVVTVDATEGVVYEGMQSDLIAARCYECEALDAGRIPESQRRIQETVAHLNLINPGSPEFRPENCRTFHDIIRFIHQKAIEEMFQAAKQTAHKERIGLRLKTSIPLLVNVIPLDESGVAHKDRGWIAEDEIHSVPMRALWKGVLEEGWPSHPVSSDLKGFLAVVGANISQGNQPEFSESSYAFVSREYMLLNLRMGYHFATIEALLTPDPTKNYIRMQYKEGGAPLERRIRRIRLICDLLARMSFEHSCQGDFLDANVSYQEWSVMIRNLRLLGRINILTKQLDMALANDAVARWYTDDFIKKLGLDSAAASQQ